MEIKVADEVWIATALLHRENPDREDFEINEIVDRVYKENLFGRLRPGVQIHASAHCVANKRPNPGNYRMLFETGRGRRRLFKKTDEYHPYREGGKIIPDKRYIPEEYWELVNWYNESYNK